jgi:hypothetical protein
LAKCLKWSFFDRFNLIFFEKITKIGCTSKKN